MRHAARMALFATALLFAGAVVSARAMAAEPTVTQPGMPWPVVEDRETPAASESASPTGAEAGPNAVTEPGMPWPVVRDGASQGAAATVPLPSSSGTNTATEPGLPWPVISEEEAKRLKVTATPSTPASPPEAPAGEAPATPERSVTEPGMPWPVVQEPPRSAPQQASPQPSEASDRAACAAALKDALAAGPLTFAAGGAEIEVSSRPILTKVAAAVKSCGRLSILIVGHTDSRGSDARNLALSMARAAAVARFLTRQGIAEDRLKTEGYGASRPVASNDTAAGRAMNRRIEVLVAPGGAGPS